jgi:hypothetical protein
MSGTSGTCVPPRQVPTRIDIRANLVTVGRACQEWTRTQSRPAAGANAASAVATATTLGYLGLLVGPPLVGAVAQATSLSVSFLVLAGVAAAVAAAATRLRLV